MNDRHSAAGMSKNEARAILGVGRRATAPARRAAFRRRAMELHPDRGGDPAAFRSLMQAMSLLEGDVPAADWVVDADRPGSPSWWAYDSVPPQRRTDFGRMFRGALRRQDGPHESPAPAETGGSARTRTNWITDDSP